MMKRLFDLILTLPVLIIIEPLFLLISVLVWLKLGSPIIFKQVRPGRYGKSFVLYKFRTMIDDCDKYGKLLYNADRIISFGKLLRSTSLDELPTLWNVFKGDMSLVGPRPLLIEYLNRYTSEQARRHEVKPGITGWAQVNGRNAITWEEKFKYDVWYVDNWNLLLDIKIIFITIINVIKREGINQLGHATMAKFKGNSRKL